MGSTDPRPGRFFDPDPASIIGPDPDPQSIGPALIELGRLGTKRYRLCRRFGYRDPKTDDTFVVPRDLTWTCDLSSNPVVFSWIIPVLGHHFNAILLHDCLVEGLTEPPSDQGTDYIGPKVPREDVDRIARDAMRELGTGFIRRWMAWAGMLMGTAWSKEGIGGPTRRLRYLILLVLHLLVIAILGGLAIADLFDAISFYPWMGDRAFVIELATGLAASVVIAALLSVVWWRRWRFPLVFGLILAPLLPALLVTAALSLLYLVLEFLVGLLPGLVKDAPDPLEPDQLCN